MSNAALKRHLPLQVMNQIIKLNTCPPAARRRGNRLVPGSRVRGFERSPKTYGPSSIRFLVEMILQHFKGSPPEFKFKEVNSLFEVGSKSSYFIAHLQGGLVDLVSSGTRFSLLVDKIAACCSHEWNDRILSPYIPLFPEGSSRFLLGLLGVVITLRYPLGIALPHSTKILDKAEKSSTTSLETVGRFSSHIPGQSLNYITGTLRDPASQWNAGSTLAQKTDHLEPVRKEVLSILNKVTAENFEQQAKNILNVGIHSSSILNVIVRLIFQKAINEPKFTALYAQLCLKLCSSAPNFEPKGSPKSTFRIFLLKLCEDEFKARNGADDPVARQRSLGNVRFIAELGQLGFIPEKILHQCVRAMLSGRTQPVQSVTSSSGSTVEDTTGRSGAKIREESLATDMECLCLFLKVVGKSMDTPKAHNLMNQYFQRLQRIQARAMEASSLHGESEDGSNCSGGRPRTGSAHEVINSPKSSGVKSNVEVLPARIRFMIDDILDLRSNGWVPRRAGQRGETNKPRYLRDIRMEVFKDSGTLVAPTPAERSVSSRDVPGSEYANHLSATSNALAPFNVPFFSGSKSRMVPFCPSVGDSSGVEARNWLELARLGEELCRNSPADVGILGSGRSSISSRQEGGFSVANKRLVYTKSGSGMSANNNNHNNGYSVSSKFGGPDSWSSRRERGTDGSDNGWTRGMATGARRQSSFSRTTLPLASNLPPRMLRKMASQNGTTFTQDNLLEHMPLSNAEFSDASQPEEMEARSMESKLVFQSWNPQTESGVNSGTGAATVDECPTKSSELFEPTYLNQERTPLLKSEFAVSTLSANACLINQPFQRSVGTSLRPNVPLPFGQSAPGRSSQSDSKTVTPSSRATLQAPIVHSDPPDLPDHKLSRSPTSSDEQRKLSKRLMQLFEEYRTPGDLLNCLQTPEFSGRLNVEMLATFLSRICEEGAVFPLSTLDPMESAQLFTDCANLVNMKDLKSSKSTKETSRPLASVCAHLLSRLLQSTSVIFSKSKFASIAASLLWIGALQLTDLTEPLRAGKHHPLFLLILQQLVRMIDGSSQANHSGAPDSFGTQSVACHTVEERRQMMIRWFRDSGILMSQMLPDGNQWNERLLETLEERGLSFLVPNLCLSRELNKLLTSGPLSTKTDDEHMTLTLSECLKKCVRPEDQQSPDFIHTVMLVVYEYIYRTGLELSPQSSPTELMSRERAAWTRLVPAELAGVLIGSSSRQLDALHALQIFWMSKNKPKGFLLRCFINLYNCDLVDENTFLTWKEELNPDYPAKGEALFEVNRWLTWLENAEEEDEEEGDLKATLGNHLEMVESMEDSRSSPPVTHHTDSHAPLPCVLGNSEAETIWNTQPIATL
ncbi:hypothetical protein T265_00778 [Opisthorchis viverrini]|uniref:Eukaryotic translation initiation factor 4 gamma 2 n=1 Tax=Opisthorchis viverrini TaxID=6198 RepID=A0A075A4S2_OPIVI|nr:hypothetical protein T265_00778 [Opisthorchis viverrini]KER33272.1 hypothetical protein T265_00778 [Opisthorchis viverrini]